MLSISSTQPVSKQSDSTSYPIYPTQGGAVTLDAPTSTNERFYQIMVGVTGSLIVQIGSGNSIKTRYYPLVLAGAIYPIAGDMILTSATVDGNAVTTTASNIWWFGGK